MIALLAQYHRKGNPKAGELGALFSDEDQRALPILAGMLRLSEFLERGRSQVVRAVRCHLDLPNGWLQIEALEAGDAQHGAVGRQPQPGRAAAGAGFAGGVGEWGVAGGGAEGELREEGN